MSQRRSTRKKTLPEKLRDTPTPVKKRHAPDDAEKGDAKRSKVRSFLPGHRRFMRPSMRSCDRSPCPVGNRQRHVLRGGASYHQKGRAAGPATCKRGCQARRSGRAEQEEGARVRAQNARHDSADEGGRSRPPAPQIGVGRRRDHGGGGYARRKRGATRVAVKYTIGGRIERDIGVERITHGYPARKKSSKGKFVVRKAQFDPYVQMLLRLGVG